MMTSNTALLFCGFLASAENANTITVPGIDLIDGFMKSIVSSTGGTFILFLLCLDSIRFVIAALGIIPPDMKVLGRLIYGGRDKDVVKSALIDLGYSDKASATSRIDIKALLNNKIVSYFDDSPLRLLHVISCCIKKYNDKVRFGDSGVSESNYYINTMGIVHHEFFLNQMSDILMKLINRRNHTYDFFIVPKGGNPLLAQRISTSYGKPLITAKDHNDAANPDGLRIEEIDDIIFEGLDVVLEKANKSGKKLRGAVIDCNATEGGQILNIVTKFNECITERNYTLKPLTECFVLFKLVTEHHDTDREFKDNRCTLFRYFDLSEEDKEKIHSSAVFDWTNKSGTLYDNDHMSQLVSVFNIMKEQRRVKINTYIRTYKKSNPKDGDNSKKSEEAMKGTDGAMHAADADDSVPVSGTGEQDGVGEQVEGEDSSTTTM